MTDSLQSWYSHVLFSLKRVQVTWEMSAQTLQESASEEDPSEGKGLDQRHMSYLWYFLAKSLTVLKPLVQKCKWVYYIGDIDISGDLCQTVLKFDIQVYN